MSAPTAARSPPGGHPQRAPRWGCPWGRDQAAARSRRIALSLLLTVAQITQPLSPGSRPGGNTAFGRRVVELLVGDVGHRLLCGLAPVLCAALRLLGRGDALIC